MVLGTSEFSVAVGLATVGNVNDVDEKQKPPKRGIDSLALDSVVT